MKYPFMTLPDETVITHSDIYLEQPVENGFCNATCILPNYEWKNINGFTKDQISGFQDLLEKGCHIIYKFAKQVGFGNAANF